MRCNMAHAWLSGKNGTTKIWSHWDELHITDLSTHMMYRRWIAHTRIAHTYADHISICSHRYRVSHIGQKMRENWFLAPGAVSSMQVVFRNKIWFLSFPCGTLFNQQISSLLIFVFSLHRKWEALFIKFDPLFKSSVAWGTGIPLSHFACSWSPSKQERSKKHYQKKKKNHCLGRYRYLNIYFPFAWDISSYNIFNLRFLSEKSKRKIIIHQKTGFHFLSPCMLGWQAFPNLNLELLKCSRSWSAI